MEYVILITGLALILMGLYGIMYIKNLLRIVIAFTLFDTGINIVMVTIGYIRNAAAPILDQMPEAGVTPVIVDPVPQALVLTSIVIGLGVSALMLTYVLKLYEDKKSLDINNFKDLKW
jgi:multisubunit Na+/H+ antiporter MnhC subunit